MSSYRAARRSGSPAWTTMTRTEKILGMEFVTLYFNEVQPDPGRIDRPP